MAVLTCMSKDNEGEAGKPIEIDLHDESIKKKLPPRKDKEGKEEK